MNRRAFLAVAVASLLSAPRARAAARERFERGLLWQVTQTGKQPNWLFGTLHQRDAHLLPLPEPIKVAFRSCRRFVVELVPDAEVAARFSEAARLDGDERLDRMLPAPVLAALAEKLEAQGVPRATALRLKPWAALLILTALPARDDENSLDMELFSRARNARMPIGELDSVEEQIAVFDDIPRASQLALLAAATDFHDMLPKIASASVTAYLARDLAGLQQVGRTLESLRPALAEHQRILEKKVIVDRSVVMAYRMQPFLRRGATFVAVGASHLYGDRGLPNVLRKEYGWNVRRVW